jgi:hypothetical protein
MLGMEGAIVLLVNALEARMPGKVAELQARYGVGDQVTEPDGTCLRPPALYSASFYQRLELSQYPAVEVTPVTNGRPKWNSQAVGQFDMTRAYSMRILMTERGNGFSDVDLRRKRLTLAIEECLFATPLLSLSPQAFVDTPTVTASYSTIEVPAGQGRSIAATYIGLDVIVDEVTDAPTPLGAADTIVSGVHPSMR